MATLGAEGLRAAVVVWLVVNAVNVLQSVGFVTRPFVPEVNPLLGLVIATLAVPATGALLVFRRRRADLARVQWRDPLVPVIAVPYLVLFFGSIVLMGLPMYRLDRRRWLVTVTTSVILIGSMVYAMAAGVG